MVTTMASTTRTTCIALLIVILNGWVQLPSSSSSSSSSLFTSTEAFVASRLSQKTFSSHNLILNSLYRTGYERIPRELRQSVRHGRRRKNGAGIPRGGGGSRKTCLPIWSRMNDNDTTIAQAADQQQKRTNIQGINSSRAAKKKKSNKNAKKSLGNKNNKKDPSPSQKFSYMNKQIVSQENAQALLSLLASQKGVLSAVAGGGKLSSVNLSTAIHRLTKHILHSPSNRKQHYNNNNSQQQQKENVDAGNDRSKILSDPRFALLVCCVAEAVVMSESNGQNSSRNFGGREISTIAWSISKLNIAPPSRAMNIGDSANVQENVQQKSDEVRSIIFDIAKQRSTSSANGSNPSTWVPKLSELCGLIIDMIAVKASAMDRGSFRQLELSNLIYSLATTDRAMEESFDFIIDSMIESELNPKNTDISKPQEWSIPLWCCAKSGMTRPGERLMKFISSLIDTRDGFVEAFKPQELSNLAWATATILSKGDGPQPDDEIRHAALNICRCTTKELLRREGVGYKTQELTNSVWGLATLGFGITEEQSSRSSEHVAKMYTYLPSDDPENDRSLMEQSVNLVLGLMKENHRYYRNQELNNLCWVMARVGIKDDEALETIGYELLTPRRRDLKGQDISTSLWAMATVQYSNEKLYRDLARRACEIGAINFNGQEISNTLWALGTARIAPKFRSVFDTALLPNNLRSTMDEALSDPVTCFFADGAQELIHRPYQFKAQEIKDVLLSFVWTETRHPVLFQAVAEHLVGSKDDPEMNGRGVDDFNSQGIANLAYSFARHTQLGVEIMEKYQEQCLIPATGGRLAAYTTSYLDVGEGLLRKLYSAIAESCIHNDRMKDFSPQDIANSVWAFAVMGMKHVRFLDAVNINLQMKMKGWISGERSVKNRLSGQEASNALYAFAIFNYVPDNLLTLSQDYVMDRLGGKITPEAISSFLNRRELAILCFVVSVFGEYPSNLMQIIYSGLIGIGKKSDPVFMTSLHNDGGMLGSAITSLLYLQSIKDLESPESKTFSLPNDFPLAWSSSPIVAFHNNTGGGSMADGLMDTGLLELHSSKVQTRISEAYTRIGFSHTEEYVITLEDLSNKHGIGVAPIPFELLSLDLADTTSQIGIEVDGPGHFVTNIDEVHFLEGRNILSSVGRYAGKKGFSDYRFRWSDKDQEINGSTSLKIRLMQNLGWRIVNLPFWEWYAVDGKEEEEDAYCRCTLERGR